MNLLYHHHHAPGADKFVLGLLIIFNLILISIKIIRVIIWLCKKEKQNTSLFEYTIWSNNTFNGSSETTIPLIAINGLALIFYLSILLIPYL